MAMRQNWETVHISLNLPFPGCHYSNVPGINAQTGGGWGGEMMGYVSLLLKVLMLIQ